MHTIENRHGQQLGRQIKTVSRETLSMGVDMDSRGLHWRLAKDIPPQQRLDFGLAVYYFGGLYVLIDADRGFLCVELIAQKFARLEKARANESYSIGHAFAELYDALGYGYDTTLAFSLIEQADLASIYLQDEWHITKPLTLNYGLRFDKVSAFINEQQVSPRLNLAYKLDDDTALHAGYSRYFTPPPQELAAQASIDKYAGTSNAHPSGASLGQCEGRAYPLF